MGLFVKQLISLTICIPMSIGLLAFSHQFPDWTFIIGTVNGACAVLLGMLVGYYK
jgi:hypothetical protein